MARKKHHAEHPDERWLLTYADMITLLMALFMVLYAMSQISKTKFQQVRITLKAAFSSSAIFTGGTSVLSVGSANSTQSAPNSELSQHDTPIPETGNPSTPKSGAQANSGQTAAAKVQAATTQQDRELAAARRRISMAIKAAHQQQHVRVIVDERGLVVRLITDKVTFGLGSYELQPAVKPVIATVAHVVENLPNDVRIDGYTDALPYRTELGNLGLSGDRAAKVLLYMRLSGLSGHNAMSVAHGAADPIVPNGPDGAGPRNRRVEIVVVRRTFAGTGAQTPPPLGQPVSAHPIGDGPLSPSS